MTGMSSIPGGHGSYRGLDGLPDGFRRVLGGAAGRVAFGVARRTGRGGIDSPYVG